MLFNTLLLKSTNYLTSFGGLQQLMAYKHPTPHGQFILSEVIQQPSRVRCYIQARMIIVLFKTIFTASGLYLRYSTKREKYVCSDITELYFEIEEETQKGNGRSRHMQWILGLKAKQLHVGSRKNMRLIFRLYSKYV